MAEFNIDEVPDEFRTGDLSDDLVWATWVMYQDERAENPTAPSMQARLNQLAADQVTISIEPERPAGISSIDARERRTGRSVVAVLLGRVLPS